MVEESHQAQKRQDLVSISWRLDRPEELALVSCEGLGGGGNL